MGTIKQKEINSEMLIRLNLFYEESNLYKFSTSDSALFPDKKSMRNFWISYSSVIRNSDLDICKKIIKQYDEEFLTMMKTRVNKNYNLHLKKFLEEKSMHKFDRNFFIRFTDGTNMGDFWNTNKKKIMESDDESSVKICRQFVHYEYLVQRRLKNLPEKQQERKEFLKKKNLQSRAASISYKCKLEEFAFMEDMFKFDYNNEKLFIDGTKISSFWSTFAKLILESDDELSMMIKNQYKEYKENKTVTKEAESKKQFDQRIKWFFELDLGKFSYSTKYKFEDGTLVYPWWSKNYDKISTSFDEKCNDIMNQYEEYIILIDDLKNSDNRFYDDEIYNYINRKD